ncbi:radical SAM protein [Noviherbaspirillum sp.]|uniref:radical SAM protein n=1 Tax=Noviherbaspirillum sp. TaxID=1926288 RepID=UPI002FDFC534
MASAHPNFTVIVNWNKKGFGCAKACSYCNWRGWPALPKGPQSKEQVAAFILNCKKGTISISGGADPLYRFEENLPHLLSMVRVIKEQGFKVRVITREIEHIAKLRGIVDRFSISLDSDVLAALDGYREEWRGLDIEYSIVLPPFPTSQLITLMPQYAALQRQLGRRLVLRENFNSLHKVDFSQLSSGHQGIVFVPKALCLSGRYLADQQEYSGQDILLDHQQLFAYLMHDPRIHLFGGAVKHMLSPSIHSEFTDIDLLATSTDVMTQLQEHFGYRFKEVAETASSSPRYFLGKSSRAGKPIHLVLVKSIEEARRFILAAQYDIDRVGYCDGQFFFDERISEAAIRHAIQTKQATFVGGTRDMTLFSSNRPQVEARHQGKLARRGFVIHDYRKLDYASNHLHPSGSHENRRGDSVVRLL